MNLNFIAKHQTKGATPVKIKNKNKFLTLNKTFNNTHNNP